MAELGTRNIVSRPELRPTLWHCHCCDAHIAIYSAELIESAICPICCDVTLDPRGSFEAILGISFLQSLPIASSADFKT
jgi:Zn-finger nucleic acid-binding protein